MSFDQEPGQVDVLYRGSPKAPDSPVEKRRWEKFMAAFTSCIHDLGDATFGFIMTSAMQKSANLRKTTLENELLEVQVAKAKQEAQETQTLPRSSITMPPRSVQWSRPRKSVPMN